MPPLGLGFDGGGSATRWALHGPGGVVAAGRLPAVTGYLFNAPDRSRFEEIAAELGQAVGQYEPIGRVIAGITGLSSSTAASDIAIGILAGVARVPTDHVHVEDDIWIAYHDAFAPGEGHLVYAGTGSVGLHIRADYTAFRVGGRGMLIDDAGSAFWIGQKALRHVFRQFDEGVTHRFPLADALFSAVGGSDWDRMREYAYGGAAVSPRDAIAQLARAVAASASDDPAALNILTEAGVQLGRLATLLARREGVLPVVLTGRAAALHPIIAETAAVTARPLNMTLKTVDAAATAARLAYAAGERIRR